MVIRFKINSNSFFISETKNVNFHISVQPLKFCDASTHDYDTLTPQNLACSGHSVSEVLYHHPDFELLGGNVMDLTPSKTALTTPFPEANILLNSDHPGTNAKVVVPGEQSASNSSRDSTENLAPLESPEEPQTLAPVPQKPTTVNWMLTRRKRSAPFDAEDLEAAAETSNSPLKNNEGNSTGLVAQKSVTGSREVNASVASTTTKR